MTTRAAIYCRISDDRTGAGLGVARQEADCRKLTARKGWEVAGIYVDNDLSAFSGKARPEYRRLLSDLESGAVDALVCWHPDRLHRSPRELEDFVDLVEKCKTTIATVTAGEYDLSTPAGRMVARVLGAVARGESEHKAERIKRKHLQLAEAGAGKGGGSRPFGFNPDRLTIHPTEAQIVQEAAERVLAGESPRTVAKDFTNRGHLTSTGKPWTTMTMRRMLVSGRIAGLREHHGQIVTTAVWPAIITSDQHQALRRLLLDPARRTNHGPRRYLLAGGLIRCGLCNAPLVSRPRSNKARAYTCATGPGFHGCGKIGALAEDVEALVRELVLLQLDSDDFRAAMVELAASHDSVDHAEIANQIEADELRLTELAALWADGDLSRGEWDIARKKIAARLASNREQQARSNGTEAIARYIGKADLLRERWDDMNLDQQRAAVSSVLEAIVVNPAVRGRNKFDPDRFEPVWKF